MLYLKVRRKRKKRTCKKDNQGKDRKISKFEKVFLKEVR